ncbi:hypothetical protein NE237_020152 [Protea cynaroides]|uniref:protein-disulfide reductase n=1 Tax=Protea cynaroides TaxID=273540 RepID=A0A9Q0K2C1_9MAGN|nr:hypothetical protein NE237_020152 [Protea cynaroides]
MNIKQVKIDNLSGKNIGLYFSAPRPGSCQHFLPVLVDVYNELSPQGNFEIIFVSEEKDENAFKEYFSKMPWLAIPFSDSERREQVCNALGINVMPCLLIIDGNGAVVTRYGYHEIFLFGVEGYPFTEERLELLVRQEEESKKTQSLSSILVLKSLDFVVSNDGKKVPISELEGKTVALYFFLSSPDPFIEFTSILVEVYEKLKKRGENFDVVLVPLDKDHYEEQYKEAFQKMPWLSLPLHDRRCFKLNQYFKFMSHPMLVIIGPDGKTLNPNVAEVVKNHGVQAYPFTSERLQELAQIDKAKLEAQTLESVMVMGELDFVTSKEGTRILVSQLVGKNILLYFSAAWCGACVASMPKLIKSYHEIKAKDDSFEVIFISWDNDQASFDEFFSEMPWLALPFGDERTKLISHSFEVSCIPTAIVIGPTGKNIIKNARAPLRLPGAGAYPITEERWKEIEAIIEENAKEWLKKVKHVLGDVEHELVLTRIYSSYACRWCGKAGTAWSFHCEDCDFNLHPKCALEKDKEEKDGVEDVDADDGIDQAFEEGRTNDGEVCHKA